MANECKTLEICRERGAAVVGFGISNRPLLEFLLARGIKVTVRDAKPIEDEAALVSRGVKVITGDRYLSDFGNEVIFRTPGIRPDAGELSSAVRRGAVLSSEMELFYEMTPARTVGITGSDGKTTTTTITHKLLSLAGEGSEGKVWLGGNIGAPLLPVVEKMTSADIAVTELSSFQLMTMKKAPEVAAITNITPNHLNWHTGMDEYRNAKYNILGSGCRTAVLNYGCGDTREAASLTGADIIFFSAKREIPRGLDAVYLKDGVITLRRGGEEIPIIARKKIKLPGAHNVENYMTAAALASAILSPDALVSAMERLAPEFGGVEHRLEFVRELDGITYYNGSIDSTPTRTAAALSALPDRKISLICGGYDKHIPMKPLAEAISAHGGVVSVTLTGATSELMADAFADFRGTLPPFEIIGDFEEAVISASENAKRLSADTVLLSPAAASFDRFKNFEERGRFYKSIVNGLEGEDGE
ncbi:MAG: UDP-N-acetylmuramoyl-L-alanine--D-glutamate ligase [Clostridia bacterium]|nr:UDP-N-acetylmuramoyl-L-alanine--D-glutamate ligase [Clostridia bacterium]